MPVISKVKMGSMESNQQTGTRLFGTTEALASVQQTSDTLREQVIPPLRLALQLVQLVLVLLSALLLKLLFFGRANDEAEVRGRRL